MENHINFLKKLVSKNVIDGIECYYSSFNTKQIKTLETFAKQNHILISGGSDCHGNKRPERELGTGYGNLSVKPEKIMEWILENEMINH